MDIKEKTTKTLEQQIEEINEAIIEIRKTQKEGTDTIRSNHAVNMKKLDKLQEYNKIADMTNQIFEKRLCGIENAIIQISRSITK